MGHDFFPNMVRQSPFHAHVIDIMFGIEQFKKALSEPFDKIAVIFFHVLQLLLLPIGAYPLWVLAKLRHPKEKRHKNDQNLIFLPMKPVSWQLDFSIGLNVYVMYPDGNR